MLKNAMIVFDEIPRVKILRFRFIFKKIIHKLFMLIIVKNVLYVNKIIPVYHFTYYFPHKIKNIDVKLDILMSN